MSLSKIFERLGAPLANVRWPWGAIRPDGIVVLRVWQDRTMKRDGTSYVQLTHLEKYGDERGSDNLGYSERLQHVQLIRNGAKWTRQFFHTSGCNGRYRTRLIGFPGWTAARANDS